MSLSAGDARKTARGAGAGAGAIRTTKPRKGCNASGSPLDPAPPKK